MLSKSYFLIYGFDKLDEATQKKMAKDIGLFYGLQFIVTIVMVAVLAKLMVYMPKKSPYMIAGLLWLGFIGPTQFSDVIFGGTESKWIVKKLLVLAGASLACLIAGAAVLSAF